MPQHFRLHTIYLLVPLAVTGLAIGLCASSDDVPRHDLHSSRLAADRSSAAEYPKPDLEVDSNLVQIPVTVTDRVGRIIEHLEKDDFSIYENGVEQSIVHFGAEELPVSICLAMDTSGSMARKFQKSIEAVLELLKASDPEDEYCLVRFGDAPEVAVKMTRDSAQVSSALYHIYPHGWTALLDAVYLATQEVKTGHNRRKAILLISDGGDNRSRHSEKSVKRMVCETEAQIYSIGIVAPDDQTLYPVEVDGPGLMRNISNQSGGLLFLIHGIDELPSAVRSIESAIRHQYVLGYYPAINRADGKYRHVTVKLRSADGASRLKAYWRAGYYAPAKSIATK